jgi:MYXO-CTERM domain-containing protein
MPKPLHPAPTKSRRKPRPLLFLAGIAALLLAPTVSSANTLFSDTFSSDGDVQYFSLLVTSDSIVSAVSLGYGGWASPAVLAGGFATSLALYDASGNLLAHDFVGGTAVGPGCSNGALQDPTTGFCEDATLSFFALAGDYTLALSEQGNDGPDPLSSGYLLGPGDIAPGGPFLDPGYPGLLQRTGDWALDITVTGTASEVTSTPEPAAWLFALSGLAAAAGLRIKRERGLRV